MVENNMQSNTIANVEEREVVLERSFNAPTHLVYKSFTEPARLASWWGGAGLITTIQQMDVKSGGLWLYSMRRMEDEETWHKSVYREVIPNEKLVFTAALSDKEGNAIEGLPETTVSIKFVEFEGTTRLAMRIKFTASSDLEMALGQGLIEDVTQAWDRLEMALTKDPETPNELV